MEKPTETSHGSPRQGLPQLSCDLCRSRKIKCDKQPCTACASAGAQCTPVYRLRRPRGWHVHNQQQQISRLAQPSTRSSSSVNDDLRRRIWRLEALVSKASPRALEESVSPRAATPSPSLSMPTSSYTDDKQHVVMQHPDHFWAHLTDEILHDRPLVAQLCGIYLTQVNPIVKILHRPSLSKHLVQGAPYLGYPSEHTPVETLDATVLHAAVASMTDAKCTVRFHRDRAVLLGDTRRACEAALERAGLLTTRDMTVLQAFVLYLSGWHIEEQSRAVWTLMTVAVRVAKALSLNMETDAIKEGTNTPKFFFVQQIRRHLWMTICLMDVQAGFSMTSEPLSVQEAQASYRLPRHINDAEYGPHTHPENAPPDRPGLADTTSPHELAHGLAREMTMHIVACDPEQSPFAWLVFHSAQCFVAGAQVTVLQRPRSPETSAGRRGAGNQPGTRARLCPGLGEDCAGAHGPAQRGLPVGMTVRWHALTTALAECYLWASQPSGGAPELLRDVWPTMEAAYTLHEVTMARHRGGTLRGPLGKLIPRTGQTVAALGIPVGGGNRVTYRRTSVPETYWHNGPTRRRQTPSTWTETFNDDDLRR
ncbi:Transcription factor [Niveomyces insectorum RCEF 264]|uniref:Transcription factor n=1 Tax=Niveomyces insectorum RCEF 264 TaxID=1081102 RepID=A0A167X5Z2_9HYPO|nr:Transcription factor [Niveomyces insectorum RCEF 264]